MGLVDIGPLNEAPTGKICRVFISHSGKQKRGFVAQLEKAFKELHPTLKVFLDETALIPGDDALPSIHEALGDALVGACKWFVFCLCY
jgi:hypothetical protein